MTNEQSEMLCAFACFFLIGLLVGGIGDNMATQNYLREEITQQVREESRKHTEWVVGLRDQQIRELEWQLAKKNRPAPAGFFPSVPGSSARGGSHE